MKLHEWIKEYRKEHGLSMQALADMCGFSKAYIGILEKGVNPSTNKPISPTIQTMQKIADGIGIDINDFIKMLDDDQPVTIKPTPAPAANKTLYATHRIPVLGRVAAGTPIEACEDILDYVYMDKKYENDGYKYFALKIQGHSMEPTIMDGDTVIVRQQDTIETGQIAIVLVDGEDATAKEVKEAPEGITLIGHNAAVYTPHFYSNEDIETLPLRVLGRVIEVRRDV